MSGERSNESAGRRIWKEEERVDKIERKVNEDRRMKERWMKV